MATLYELEDKYNFLYNLDFDEAEGDDWLKEIESVEADFETKAENIAKVQKNNNANIESRKAEIKRLQDLNKRDENTNKRLTGYLKNSMEATGKLKFSTPLFSFYIKKNAPSLDIETEEHISDEYYKVEKKLDKKELLADIKEGLLVDGVSVKQTESLVIR